MQHILFEYKLYLEPDDFDRVPQCRASGSAGERVQESGIRKEKKKYFEVTT